MPPPPSAAPPPPPPHARALALDQLQPLQPILRGFAHRNRNQHRRGPWWGALGMLRRHADKLASELVLLSSPLPPTTNPTTTKHQGVVVRKRNATAAAAVEQRARWLRDVLAPRCYEAFSQLAADNQFAALGVVLLAALAQVRAACGACLGGGDEPQQQQQKPSSASSLPRPEDGAAAGHVRVGAGMRVSREEVERLRREGRGATPSSGAGGAAGGSGAPPTIPSVDVDMAPTAVEKEKKKKKEGGEQEMAEVTTEKSKQDNKNDKKKKKRDKTQMAEEDDRHAEEPRPREGKKIKRPATPAATAASDGKAAVPYPRGPPSTVPAPSSILTGAKTAKKRDPPGSGDDDGGQPPARKKKKKAKKGNEFDDLFKSLF
ncbi:hypothetical protein F4775DRAFT_30038 [Biscogniauxia sp. FL1348]|nr:hypothetical protein F4775DRAFT_30038 [Biscogniauxia sp. FL1348]